MYEIVFFSKLEKNSHGISLQFFSFFEILPGKNTLRKKITPRFMNLITKVFCHFVDAKT